MKSRCAIPLMSARLRTFRRARGSVARRCRIVRGRSARTEGRMGLSLQNAGFVADDRPAPTPDDAPTYPQRMEPSVMVTAVAHCDEQIRHDDNSSRYKVAWARGGDDQGGCEVPV